MLQQLFHQCNMTAVVLYFDVITADYSYHAPQAARHDAVIQGPIGSPEGATQVMEGVFGGESSDQIHLFGRYIHAAFIPVGKVICGASQN